MNRVVRFASNVFDRFAGFEGEYLLYLTEKRVKGAERGDAKMAAGFVQRLPSTASACASWGSSALSRLPDNNSANSLSVSATG